MSSIEERINELGHVLPGAVAPVGNYVPTVLVAGSGLVYTSGHVSRGSDGEIIAGKLGSDISVDEGYEASKQTALDLLGSIKAEIGDLDRVTRVVKILCMVNCTPDFGQQPAVANGASDLLVEVFGEIGKHSRSAVGMTALPGNACVEVEAIVEISP